MQLPEYDRSQVAQRNDDAHGYWLIIDALVYDVSEFMPAHPGGERILQLYAGRDATHGFHRVHRDRRHVAGLLERCRIGALRKPVCFAQPEHAAHHAALRQYDATLQLLVEMQNALRVDHAFQLEVHESSVTQPTSARRSRYELQRGLETHIRFHREYLDVLIGESFRRLALLTPELQAGLCLRVETLQCSPEGSAARASALELLEHVERFADDQLAVSVACFEVLDSWLLRAWKRELSRALRVLERPHAATLPAGDSQLVYGVCDRLLSHLNEYFRSAVGAVSL
jgi:cytochrome b involved in lipid metabolism